MRRNLMILATAIAAVLALAGPSAFARPSAGDQARITQMETQLRPIGRPAGTPVVQTLAQRMADLKVPGVSVAFFENGKVVWVRAYGVANAAERRPVTPDTLFQAASMSKALAAAAALRLAEQGRLDLDADVNSYLKAWQVPTSAFTTEQKVTMRRLLSHTAGLTVSGFPGYAADRRVPDVVQILNGQAPANTPPVRSFEVPGGRYAYSGGGYTVAQLAILEAGGRPYPQLLGRLVLRPAQMRHSFIAQPLPVALRSGSAAGHDRTGAVIPGEWNTYPEYAAAGLWTTPGDYGRFMIGLQDAYLNKPAFLKPASARAMLTPVHAGYGLGMVIEPRGARTAFTHGGSNFGFQCLSFAFLDGSRQGAVVMTNSDAGGPLVAEVMRALGEAYGWGDVPPRDPAGFARAPLVPAAPK